VSVKENASTWAVYPCFIQANFTCLAVTHHQTAAQSSLHQLLMRSPKQRKGGVARGHAAEALRSFLSNRVHWPSFRWLWASIVMHNKHNVNQPSRTSTINATALLFYMAHISLRQGHLSLLGARTCVLSGCGNQALLTHTRSLWFSFTPHFLCYWF